MKDHTSPPKKRIALIARNLALSSLADRLLLDYLRPFSQWGFEIIVLAEKCDKEWLVRLPSAKLQGVYKLPLFSGLQENFFTWRCQQILAGEKFDLIFSQGDWPDTHMSFALNFEDFDPNSSSVKSSKIKNFASARCLIVPSQIMKKMWVDKLAGVPDSAEICYPCYPREVFNMRDKVKLRAAGRDVLALPNEALVVGASQNDAETAEWAQKIFADANAIAQPGGINPQQMMKFVLIGPADRDYRATEASHYHALDVFLHPSKPEAFNVSTLEAMACGLPVVLASGSGTCELIQSRQLILPLENRAAWAQNMHDLLTNRDWARSIARQNSERALLFDEPQLMKRYTQILAKYSLL